MSCLDPSTIKDLTGFAVIGLIVIFGGIAGCIAAWKGL